MESWSIIIMLSSLNSKLPLEGVSRAAPTLATVGRGLWLVGPIGSAQRAKFQWMFSENFVEIRAQKLEKWPPGCCEQNQQIRANLNPIEFVTVALDQFVLGT